MTQKYYIFLQIDRGQAIPGAELLMGDLPLRLQEEVAFEEMQKIITKVILLIIGLLGNLCWLFPGDQQLQTSSYHEFLTSGPAILDTHWGISKTRTESR